MSEREEIILDGAPSDVDLSAEIAAVRRELQAAIDEAAALRESTLRSKVRRIWRQPHGRTESRDAGAATRPGGPVRRIHGRGTSTAARTGYPPVLAVGHASQSPIFGAERSLLDVIKVLDTTGYEIHAVFPHDNPEYFEAALDHVSTLSVFDYRWWRDARAPDEEVVSQFAELMRELEIGIVHVNTVMLPEPLEAAQRLGITSVVHVREDLTHDPYLTDTIGFSAAEIASQVRDRADYVIGNSDAALRAFDCQDEGFRVYNGVDVAHLDIENPVSPPVIRVGLISSNVPKKGLDDFVWLAKLAEDELPHVRFVLIGPENEHVARLL